MIREETVIIVGAGASVDLGLPLGGELKKRVVDLLSTPVRSELQRSFHFGLASVFDNDHTRVQETLGYAQRFRDAILNAASIDNFLDQHRHQTDFIEAAKLAIAVCIAESEKGSSLACQKVQDNFFGQTKKYFLNDLMTIVARGHDIESIRRSLENVTFVTFNYDRCIQRYIALWMKNSFGVDEVEALGWVKCLHVYGSLGDLNAAGDVQSPFNYQGDTPFQNLHLIMPKLKGRIKTFTEQEDADVATEIDDALTKANVALFVGFGFEEQNMRFFSRKHAFKAVYATVHSFSEENAVFMEEHLTRLFIGTVKGKVKVKDSDGSGLISANYHKLTRDLKSV